jgi:hypothetical protein
MDDNMALMQKIHDLDSVVIASVGITEGVRVAGTKCGLSRTIKRHKRRTAKSAPDASNFFKLV